MVAGDKLEGRGFLGQPTSVARRWAKAGMPVTREGRFVTASPEALNEWLERESGTGLIHVDRSVGGTEARSFVHPPRALDGESPK